MTRSGGGVKKFDLPCASGRSLRIRASTSSAMRSAASGRLILVEILAPFLPERGALWQRLPSTSSATSRFFSATAPRPYSLINSRVAFLLAGNDLVDNHRAARGDGFLHGRAAGLADDQMVRHHQFAASDSSSRGCARGRRYSCVRSISFAFNSGVAPDGDGQMHVSEFPAGGQSPCRPFSCRC